MEKQELAKILEEVRSNPEAVKDLREQGAAETREEAAAIWAKAAASLGHDVSAEEILAYIRDSEEEMKRRTRAGAEGIEQISDREAEEAAGGKGHDKCQVSYKDRENCWFADACDNVAVIYPGYKCHKFFEDTCSSFMG